jgi:hypothetical protein
MNSKFFLTAIFILLPFAFVLSQPAGNNFSYVGVDVCAPCHKTEKQGRQLDIWKESKHSKAFQTLQTERADAIAKEKGFNTPAAETEACLKCHVSGYDVDASLLGAKFKMEDGVQCETCHGPGSEYRNLKVMQSREESIAKGLLVYENIGDLCIQCHNEESPTHVEQDFNELWQLIQHYVPEKSE